MSQQTVANICLAVSNVVLASGLVVGAFIVRSLKQQVEETRTDLTTLDKRLTSTGMNVSNWVGNHNSEHNELGKVVSNIDKGLASLTGRFQDLENRMQRAEEAAKKSKDEAEAEVDKLTGNIEYIKSEMEELKQQTQVATQAIDNFKGWKLRCKFTQLENKLAQLENKLAQLGDGQNKQNVIHHSSSMTELKIHQNKRESLLPSGNRDNQVPASLEVIQDGSEASSGDGIVNQELNFKSPSTNDPTAPNFPEYATFEEEEEDCQANFDNQIPEGSENNSNNRQAGKNDKSVNQELDSEDSSRSNSTTSNSSKSNGSKEEEVQKEEPKREENQTK